MWRLRPGIVCTPIVGLGSFRRIWVKWSSTSSSFVIGVVYLPCGNDKASVDAFLNECAQLADDIELIGSIFELLVVLVSDFDIQPFFCLAEYLYKSLPSALRALCTTCTFSWHVAK